MIQQLSARGRRLAAVGALIGLTFGVGGIAITSASGPATPSSFVPITPCRLMDTHSGTNTVGPRNTPLVGGTPYVATVRGTNGNCTIPAGATAVGLNVTSLNHSSGGFLTVWPSDDPKPLSSSLNWVSGQAPIQRGHRRPQRRQRPGELPAECRHGQPDRRRRLLPAGE